MTDHEAMMLKAAIFDMDGILIDSEPLWQEAQTTAFARVGVHLTKEMCFETTGLRVDEVVKQRFEQFKWQNKSPDEVEAEILAELQQLILERGQPIAGVRYILDFFKERDIRLALASSTHFEIIQVVLKRLELEGAFEVIHSAEFEQYGKPHPAIYLTTLARLDLAPWEAVAFEDSFNGLLAAKAARLKTVVIPAPAVWHETKYDIADLKLKSLSQFTPEHLRQLS
ncbi:MAG: hexitol phosphatase HxpB [bacterium]